MLFRCEKNSYKWLHVHQKSKRDVLWKYSGHIKDLARNKKISNNLNTLETLYMENSITENAKGSYSGRKP